MMREAFISSQYALVGPDLIPNPDYWISLSFKHFFFDNVIIVKTLNLTPLLRVYAARNSQSDELSYLVINIDIKMHKFRIDQEPYVFDSR